MLPQETIRRKRDGLALDDDEIAQWIASLTSGAVGDAQVGAFAMAVAIRGMTGRETVALTRAMTASGDRLDWLGDGGPVVDKHSTGGIGDKVSLVLAPLLAACGTRVPMISGRGLGHTGGTLDKLDAIPGYRSQPDLEHLRRAVGEAGCAIVGQTADLAPADRRLYAIRDVTGTVESLPLIVSSILSKKLAAGLDALVMDVKVGSGAFLPDLDAARALADTLVEVAGGAGLPCRALLTDMSMCLGRTAGNALEVGEAIGMIRGEPGDPRLEEVVLSLAGEALAMVGVAPDADEGRRFAAQRLRAGAAVQPFQRMVSALGGPGDLVDRPHRHLAAAPVTRPLLPARAGIVQRIDARALGLAVIGLGGGRTRPDQSIDHAVGLEAVAAVGDQVDRDHPLLLVHARSEEDADAVGPALQAAVEVGDGAPRPSRVILERRPSG